MKILACGERRTFELDENAQTPEDVTHEAGDVVGGCIWTLWNMGIPTFKIHQVYKLVLQFMDKKMSAQEYVEARDSIINAGRTAVYGNE